MQKFSVFIVFCTVLLFGFSAAAQDLKTNVGNNKELDSLRKKEENKKDSVVFNSKYIRYTTLRLTKDSIQTIPIDTGLAGIQNFSVLAQPRRPTVGLGVLGLAAKPLLFEPVKTIGFETGFHSLDFYTLNDDDVKFYTARTPFTSLYYVNGSDKEQVLKMIHTQNINKNLNIGATFDRIGANGFYTHQRGDVLNASLFSWFQSPNKRYNLWVDAIFNTLKADENGSIVNENIFEPNTAILVDKLAETVRLTTARQRWRKNSIMIKQSYFVGRIDSTGKTINQNILPTNKITYTLKYSSSAFAFKKDENDTYGVLPETEIDPVFTKDSTNVKHLQNEFVYSFFLRAKGNSVIKNELKIDAGIRHDFYNYGQYGLLRDTTYYYSHTNSFQNITLLGNASYRFSNRVDINVDLQQIFQGQNTGDFLYEAKSNVLLSNTAGRIILGAYLQNKSPEEIYRRYFGNYYNWNNTTTLDRTKTANVSFNYLNERFKIDASASYSLLTNYIYFIQKTGTQAIMPEQEGGDISVLKLSLGKKFQYKSWHLDSYAVYQKTDNNGILRIPEFYTFHSIYKDQTFFKRLKTQIGADIRYNTSYVSQAYSPAASQFYNDDQALKFGSKPVIDVWVKAGLKRANIFLKYDYANQGVFSKGFYTVNRYPMPDRLLKFGVSWNFYD